MTSPILLAVPNVSEGRDPEAIARIGEAFVAQARACAPASAADASASLSGADTQTRLLDVHSDADHHRSVFTLAGHAPQLAASLVHGAAAAIGSIDVVKRGSGAPADAGAHPHVGAIDVIPLVSSTRAREAPLAPRRSSSASASAASSACPSFSTVSSPAARLAARAPSCAVAASRR